MLSSRTSQSTQSQFSNFLADHPLLVLFFGLNAIRVIGIISLILVLASSILVMVTDITAVNSFLEDAKNSGTPVDQLLEGCDYIEYASSSSPTFCFSLSLRLQEQHRPEPNWRSLLGRRQSVADHHPSRYPHPLRM